LASTSATPTIELTRTDPIMAERGDSAAVDELIVNIPPAWRGGMLARLGDTLNEPALAALVRAGVEHNVAEAR
jgi:hypothetical protein